MSINIKTLSERIKPNAWLTPGETGNILAASMQEAADLRAALAKYEAQMLRMATCAGEFAREACAAQAPSAPQPMSEHNARFAIDGAIQYGRECRNKPPSDDHWLMEYWLIGQQLRALGKTGWDNVTPLEPAPSAPVDVCAQMRALYSACGGTGDVHSIDGEWRGSCDCQASAPVASQDERRSFEAWCKTRENAAVRLKGTDQYVVPAVQAAWVSWQARAALSVKVESAASADPAVELNVAMLRSRSAVGVSKYGVTMADSKLPLRAWLVHALEELLDGANYLQRAMQDIDAAAPTPPTTAETKPSTLAQQAASAQAEVADWPEGKLAGGDKP